MIEIKTLTGLNRVQNDHIGLLIHSVAKIKTNYSFTGKSTTFKMLTGEIPITAGDATINGYR